MTSPEAETPTFTLNVSGRVAKAAAKNGQFQVLEDSFAKSAVVPSFTTHGYNTLRQALINEGALTPDQESGLMKFSTSTVFTSSSAAAAVILGRAANGKREWTTQGPDGRVVTYGDWVISHHLPPEREEPFAADFLWKPFFRELSIKLLEYERQQPELIQILTDAGVKVPHDDGEDLKVLDPFSFFSLILKHQSNTRATQLFKAVGERLDLKEQAPDDLAGVPWSNPMNAWFFAYATVRQPEDLPTLWALAKQTVAGQLDGMTFQRALAIRKVALPKLTAGLFWLNPDVFLPLNGVIVPYLERRGVRGAAKVKTLDEMKRILAAARQLNPEFADLSLQAWLASEEGKSVARLLESGGFPFTQFRQEADQYLSNTPKGNINTLLDDRYAPLLLSLIDGENYAWLKPSRSPYTGKTQLAVKIGLGGGVKEEAGSFARALLIPSKGYVDYLPLPMGLTLEVGLPDGHVDGPREALRNPNLMDSILRALLKVPEELRDVGFSLTSDFPEIKPFRITPDAQLALQNALMAYMAGSGKSRRLWIGLTLSPEELESAAFTDLLELALDYIDRVVEVLEQLVSYVPPIIVVPPPISRTTFIPVPGVSFNQILYGPPGTGKTYRVIDEALSILDPELARRHAGQASRAARKARYDVLVAEGRISFVTFHQSFGYEDFIEGIKPVMENGRLSYHLQDGVFLEAVRSAGGFLPRMNEGAAQAAGLPAGLRADGQVWRLYIGGASPDSPVRERSLARGEMRIGSWGKTPVDLCELPIDDLTAQQLLFRDSVRVGDLMLLATGSNRVSAVGVVTGDYRFDPKSDAAFASDYAHVRSVRWLAQGLTANAQEITGKQFSPQALQRVADVDPVTVLERAWPNPPAGRDQPDVPALRPHVLIIDEINRGNVAKIFGELITLLEGSKRAGAKEALTTTLPLSRRPLSVPQSLYVIGTMNTADRSLTLLDSALRRRFVFKPVWPQPEVLPVLVFDDGTALDLRKFLFAINARIERLLSREQVIGHAYLLDLPEVPTLADVALALKERILPLLEEYFFDDWGKIREVLGDDDQKDEALQFLQRVTTNGQTRYVPNDEAYKTVEAFILVYAGLEESVFKFDS